jgi:hypothetical protein
MVAAMALVQGFYAAWAFADPTALAAYRGTSVSAEQVAWVYAYGSRTLFVAAVVAMLLIRKDLASLRWVALLGLVMPVIDAVDAARAGLPCATVARHAGTAVYLLITFAVLHASMRRAADGDPTTAPQ